MAAAHRSISSVTYASRTNTTVTAPASIIDGDILVLMFIIGAAGTPPTPTLPSGFTVIQGPTTINDGSFQVTRRLAWKVCSSESGNYTVTHSSASSQGVIIAVSGGNTGATPVTSSNSGTGSTSTGTGITTPSDNSWVGFMGHNWNLFGSTSPPSGTTPTFTERLDATTSLIYCADGVLATAGATGNKSHTTPNNSIQPWAQFMIAIGEAGGGGGGSIIPRVFHHRQRNA